MYVQKDPTFMPPKFVEKMKELVPAKEWDNFILAMNTRLRKSFRVNTLKGESREVYDSLSSQNFSLEKMPWYKDGFFISTDDKKNKIGNTLEHFLGQIYVQEASSMLPPLVLDPKEEECILDMAASPGSKTTQMAAQMNNTGSIVANEPQMSRIPALQDNLERCGAINHTITRNDGRLFRQFENTFDRVLVDAPCSVEGTFRKDIKARYIWSPGKVYELSKLQKELLESAISATKSGGMIVYSTCTLSPEENELVVQDMIEKDLVSVEKINIKDLNSSSGITKYREFEIDNKLKDTVRIWPHKINLEGFYLAKLKKK